MATWRQRIYWALLLMLWLQCPQAVAEAVLATVQIAAANAQQADITLILSQKPIFKIFTLHGPERLVIDLHDTRIQSSLPAVPAAQTLVTALRLGKQANMGLRLVVDLPKPLTIKATVKHDPKSQQAKLVITLAAAHPVTQKNLEVTTKATAKLSQANSKPDLSVVAPQAAPQAKPAKPIVIVLDPGHGGKDPGAVGQRGTQEKQIVLTIAQKLAHDLNQIAGLKAVLTRECDCYLPLRQRLRVARQAKADIFIAIHADAYADTEAMGSSVFALSEHGASSEAARWLAEKENYSELGGVRLGDKSDLLRSVLIDLSQTATISASLELGQLVLQQLGAIGALHRGRVEQARFVVLKSPDIPSLLIETGFITNAIEEQRLQSVSYQQKLSTAIQQGIKAYFTKRRDLGYLAVMAPGTALSSQPSTVKMAPLAVHNSSNTAVAKVPGEIAHQTVVAVPKKVKHTFKHTIVPGETLAVLAQRYHSELDLLRQANHLEKHSGVRVGQVVLVPVLEKTV